jgi:hypothetical protein
LKHLEVHNNVTAAQMAIEPGQRVIVIRDDGTAEERVAESSPTTLCTALVVRVSGLGYYALSRVLPWKTIAQPGAINREASHA